MLKPLLMTLSGSYLFFGAVWLRRMQNEVLHRERRSNWVKELVAA